MTVQIGGRERPARVRRSVPAAICCALSASVLCAPLPVLLAAVARACRGKCTGLADPCGDGAAAAGDAVQQPPVQHGRCRSPSDEAACAGRFGCAGCAENTSCANRHVEHGESRGLPDTRVRITTLPAGAPARPRSRVGRRQTRSDDRRGALRAVRVLSDHATGHIN
jgi:hypothetical protein